MFSGFSFFFSSSVIPDAVAAEVQPEQGTDTLLTGRRVVKVKELGLFHQRDLNLLHAFSLPLSYSLTRIHNIYSNRTELDQV